ncbi:MAG: hypothetical protein ACI9HI_000122 [Salinirussus sp.]
MRFTARASHYCSGGGGLTGGVRVGGLTQPADFCAHGNYLLELQMYGNSPLGDDSTVELTASQRRTVRQDLASVAARTRNLLPGEFVVGSELRQGAEGPRATVAVRPPVGSVVSADYELEDSGVVDTDRDELARGLAASAALQVKRAMPDDPTPTAK